MFFISKIRFCGFFIVYKGADCSAPVSSFTDVSPDVKNSSSAPVSSFTNVSPDVKNSSFLNLESLIPL